MYDGFLKMTGYVQEGGWVVNDIEKLVHAWFNNVDMFLESLKPAMEDGATEDDGDAGKRDA